MVIVETSVFTRQVSQLLSDDAYRQLQIELTLRPYSGVLIPGSGGLRKLRWGLGTRGKRGGSRIIYYWAAGDERLLMLLIYPKNVQDNLSPNQIQALRQLVEREYR